MLLLLVRLNVIPTPSGTLHSVIKRGGMGVEGRDRKEQSMLFCYSQLKDLGKRYMVR